MSRLVGLRGSGQYRWQWFLLDEYRKLPPPARWLGLASLLASVIAIVFAIGFALYSTQETSAAPLRGAIFTTTPDGGIVNENVHYERKIEVYLDGGPGPNAPKTAAGLPDGEYYFQVTDPSGKVLLSEDPAKCRKIYVENGVIVELLNVGATYGPKGHLSSCHIADPPDPPSPAGPGDAGTSGRHDTNVDLDHGEVEDGERGAIVVQLMPFLDTPNPGGVYKAWIIPTDRYIANGGKPDDIPKPLRIKGQQVGFQRDRGFGPPRDQVKTDNFKVKEFFPPEITVRKFHDINGDGIWQRATEPEIGTNDVPGNAECVKLDGTLDPDCGPDSGGWPYEFTEPVDGGTVTNDFFTPHTHVAGIPGTYTACEFRLPGWIQSVAYLDSVRLDAPRCVDITVAGASGETHEVIFGNFMPGEKHGQKFIDLNANGQRDAGEDCPTNTNDPNYAGCVDVTVKLDGTDNMNNDVHLTTTTCGGSVACPDGKPYGSYWFTGLNPGTYTVTVVEPEGFECSSPSPCQYDFTLVSGDVEVGNDFGDFSRAEIHGLKFHDLDGDGQPREPSEPPIEDVTIHLEGEDGIGNPVHMTTLTCGGSVSCPPGTPNGSYWFTDLRPGTYTITEDPPVGLSCSFPDPCRYAITLVSDQVASGLDFGNMGPCNGLTPGYWKNWRNHYNRGQMRTLLEETIASGITEADDIFDHWDASPGDELSILKAMTLANQLTINLTQNPGLPNPSEGSLFGFCTLPDDGANLEEILEMALEYIDRLEDANSDNDPSRDEILRVASILDAFANLRTS